MQNTSTGIKGLNQRSWLKQFSLPPRSFPWIAPPHAEWLHSEYICNILQWKNYVFSILPDKSSKSHTCTAKETCAKKCANISPHVGMQITFQFLVCWDWTILPVWPGTQTFSKTSSLFQVFSEGLICIMERCAGNLKLLFIRIN